MSRRTRLTPACYSRGFAQQRNVVRGSLRVVQQQQEQLLMLLLLLRRICFVARMCAGISLKMCVCVRPAMAQSFLV